MEDKALAFLYPVQHYTNKDWKVLSYIQFLTGKRKGKSCTCVVNTDIYKYYYFGLTLEVVEFDREGNIIDVRDVRANEFKQFNLDLLKVYSFNQITTEMLCSNGFVYILNQSRLYRDYQLVCDNILNSMQTANNFVMYVYTMNNTLLFVNVEFNISPSDKRYKRAIHRGFITADKNLLKMMSPVTASVNEDKNEKLSQDDIDKLLLEMSHKNEDCDEVYSLGIHVLGENEEVPTTFIPTTF